MALTVKLNGEKYKVPLSVADITIRTHVQIVSAEASMPEKLRAILGEKDTDKRTIMSKRLKKSDYAKEFLPYYAKVVSIATGIPVAHITGDKERDGMPVPLLEQWYWNIMGAYANWANDPGKDNFEVGGTTFHLPDRNMEKATFGEFAEAAQYEDHVADIASGNWEAMPYIMAVLLRPKGERFDPSLVEARAKVFEQSTMDVAYQVAFFLLRRNERSRADSLIYTLNRLSVLSRRVSGN